jgi:hypothetical protein
MSGTTGTTNRAGGDQPPVQPCTLVIGSARLRVHIALQSYDGHFLAAERGGGGPATATRTAIGPWETFYFNGGAPPAGGHTLDPGQSLNPGQSVYSPDGRFRLTYQTDANFVLYRSSDNLPLWAINCWPVCNNLGAPGHAIMQTDGNLVVYDANGAPVWNSGTFGHPGAYLQVQNDGNMVVYDTNGSPLWWTGTGG